MADYAERVYAGVLGKIIGVYLGRPFEGWSYDQIMAELGEIDYYVNEKLGKPLIVTDDDITGTFTFLRAFEDHGFDPNLTPEQIGHTWLNYIVENRAILWWGGMGLSTEHTAYQRLKNGISAPQSGSTAMNGRLVAEQIGAQIFIDGWGMINPGNPARAADFARRAASVSHDGEAIYAAQVIAAMEAAAFVESDLNTLLDTALSLIPRDSVISRLIHELREVRAQEPDWRKARAWLQAHYGYDQYGGSCHVVPNHGVIILGLLYGEDDFQTTLKIVNTSGWDTDCNSGNAGCLLGIKNGLAGIDASAARGFDFRTPIADRLYLPTADGGSAVSDAVQIADQIAWMGSELNGEALAYSPLIHDGLSYHFSYPGSVQGFTAAHTQTQVENVALADGVLGRALRIQINEPIEVRTAVFIPPDAIDMEGYELLASPRLYSGNYVTAEVIADAGNRGALNVALIVSVYTGADTLRNITLTQWTIQPGATAAMGAPIPDTGGQPIAELGLAISGEQTGSGTLYLRSIRWISPLNLTLCRPADGGEMWRRAWVKAVDGLGDEPNAESTFHIVHNGKRGMLITGSSGWANYTVETTLILHMSSEAGIAVHVNGLRRYYAVLLCADDTAKLIRMVDGVETVLAQQAFQRVYEQPVKVRISTSIQEETWYPRLNVWLDDVEIFNAADTEKRLFGGAIALVVSEGRLSTGDIHITSA